MSEPANPWGLLVSFEDQSHSFVHGFEAGMLWSVLAGPVESDAEQLNYTVHTANRQTTERMAKSKGWDVSFEATDYDDWIEATFTRAKPRMRLVGR